MATNAAILEALWGFGYDPAKLRGISTRGSQRAWTTALLRQGIRGVDIDAATRMADWRVSDKGGTPDKLQAYLTEVLGWDANQLKATIFTPAQRLAAQRAGQPGINVPGKKGETTDEDYLQVMRGLMSPNAFTQMPIKLGQGDKIAKFQGVPEWNPLRNDAPKPTGVPGVIGGPRMRITGPGQEPSGPLETMPPGGEGFGAGGAGAGAGAGTGGGAPAPFKPSPPRSPEEIIAYIKKWYGGNAWYLDIPEVRDMMFEGAQNERPPDEMQQRLMGTQWWNTTSGKTRSWIAYEKSDPETAKIDVGRQVDVVNGLAAKLGIELTPERAREMADSFLRFGWNENDLNKALGDEFYYDPEDRKGGATVEGLKSLARDFYVPLSDDTMKTWGRDIIAGTSTQEQYGEYLRDQAKSLFPHLTAALDRGETVAKFVDPYFEMAKGTLAIGRETMDYMDPKWMKPLTNVNEKGERTVMSLDQWQTTLRTDEQYGYQKTQQAKDEAANLAKSITEMFGVR